MQNLRREDAETLELADKDPREAYWRLLSRSMHAGAALVDGRPAAMWGAAVDNFLQTDFAHLWLLIGGDIKRPAHVIARGALPFVQQMQTCYGRLLTTVAWGHERDHRWVRWLGFRRCPEQDRRTERGVFLAYERD